MSLQYRVERAWAGHCTSQQSKKDWAGTLVHVIETQAETTHDESSDASAWIFLTVWGKSGANLQASASIQTTRSDAKKAFDAKVKEKKKHHYEEVTFAPFLSAFPVPLTMSGIAGAERSIEKQSIMTVFENAFVPTRVPLASGSNAAEAITSWQDYANARYGVTEKANGERCLLSLNGSQSMQGYNRNGEPTRTVPASASALASLGCSCVLDGERMVGQQEGQYVVFDVLQWDGEDIRSLAYRRRIALLQNAFRKAALIRDEISTPTLARAAQNSLIEGLMLLTPVKGAENMERVVAVVRQRAGEEIILRELGAAYSSPKAVLKYKFTADIDVVVIGIKPGPAGGSLKIGLRRPTDNAILACGHVRSGLTNRDIAFFAEQLQQGRWMVIKVMYRLGRTRGIALGEPSTSREWIRSDKDPWSCTTDQLGEEKASLVLHASALPNMSFPQPYRVF